MRTLVIVWLFVLLAGIVGWAMNFAQVIVMATSDAGVNAMFILKCIGILLAPLGALLGWIG